MVTLPMLRDIAVTQLTGQTNAGANVFSPRDWPTGDALYPCLLLQTPQEDKTSLGRATPMYTVVGTLRVTARVQNVSEIQAEADLETLRGQIEGALIGNPALMMTVQQIAWVRSAMKVSADGDYHLGELMLEFGLEFFQGPDDFYPNPGVPLTEVKIVTDLGNVFDATGVYPPSSAADVPDADLTGTPEGGLPAPRTSGPDGRNEGIIVVTLPQ